MLVWAALQQVVRRSDRRGEQASYEAQVNVTALFLDGAAGQVCVSKEEYGPDETWVLVGKQVVLDA